MLNIPPSMQAIRRQVRRLSKVEGRIVSMTTVMDWVLAFPLLPGFGYGPLRVATLGVNGDVCDLMSWRSAAVRAPTISAMANTNSPR